MPEVHRTVVRNRRDAAPGIAILEVEAPQLRAVQPGQFAMVVPPRGELPATALGIYDVFTGGIALMVVVVGPRTRELAQLASGAELTLLAPLGNGFDVSALGDDVALIAGGVGLASLLLPARAILERGARATLYYGARTETALVDADKFRTLGIAVNAATDDGSCGHRGYVTDAFAGDAARYSGIAACGPSPMLRAVGRIAARHGVRAQLSLEETFACGVGACWGCVVPLSRASAQAPPFPAPPPEDPRAYVHARICKEGPVFWAHELQW